MVCSKRHFCAAFSSSGCVSSTVSERSVPPLRPYRCLTGSAARGPSETLRSADTAPVPEVLSAQTGGSWLHLVGISNLVIMASCSGEIGSYLQLSCRHGQLYGAYHDGSTHTANSSYYLRFPNPCCSWSHVQCVPVITSADNFQGFKIFLACLTAVYSLFLLYLLIRAFVELRNVAYFGEQCQRMD